MIVYFQPYSKGSKGNVFRLRNFVSFNDANHVTVAHCTKKFCTKNLEKVEKIMNIQEYSKKIQKFSSLPDVCLHVTRSKVKYLSTEKTSKNLRNSA